MYYHLIHFIYRYILQVFPRDAPNAEVFVSCTEQSGDELASELLGDLPAQYPSKFLGITGTSLRSKGVTTLLKMEEFCVMGFSAVLKKAPSLLKNYLFTRNTILKRNPAICIFVDSPNFHLPLAKGLRMRGYRGKIVQYVCPSVWLYKKGRVKTLNQYFDEVWGIFPFEKVLVHTLDNLKQLENPTLAKVNQVKQAAAKSVSTAQTVTLFPGSRKSEIELNFPIMLEVVNTLKKHHPNVNLAISLAHEQFHDLIVGLLCKQPHLKEVTLFDCKENFAWMQSSTFSLAVSGTISLELALLAVPHLCLYKMSNFNHKIACYLLNPPPRYITLPNIIMQVAHWAAKHNPQHEDLHKLPLQIRLAPPLVAEHFGTDIDREAILIWCCKMLNQKLNAQKRAVLAQLPDCFSTALTNEWARNMIVEHIHETKDA